MTTLIIGIPNAGKTTFSQRYKSVVHLDEVGFKKAEILATSPDVDCIEGVYRQPHLREQMVQACKAVGKKCVCVWLDTSLETCLEREHKYRNRGESVVNGNAQSFQPPTYAEGWDEIIIVRNGEEIFLER